MYRLGNLRLIGRSRRESLRGEVDMGLGRDLARLMGLPDPQTPGGDFRRRFLSLGMEALRRQAISRGKLRELSRRIGVEEEELEKTLERVGLAAPPVDVRPDTR